MALIYKGLFYAAVFASLGVSLIYRGLALGRKRKRLLKLPHQRIGTAISGIVEFQGYAWTSGSLPRSDITGRPTAFVEWKLQTLTGFANTEYWTDLHHFRSGEDFIILDATGAARISLSADAIDLQTRHFLISELSESQKKLLKETFPKMPAEALEARKENWAGFTSDPFRIEERILSLGCPLSA